MRFQFDEAVDDLHARTLELSGPGEVLLLVEARLQFDHGRYRLARFGRVDQRADHGGLFAGAVERLLDGDDLRVGGSLAQKGNDHLEALIGVMNDDVLLADGGKAVAAMLPDAFGGSGHHRART